MNRLQLRALLDEVRSGTVTPEAAHERLLQFLRQTPFEDLGFARVDHHRSIRQGFPEVVFGQGKTPDTNRRDCRADRRLRATTCWSRGPRPRRFAAVVERLPAAAFHELARTITLRIDAIAARPRHDPRRRRRHGRPAGRRRSGGHRRNHGQHGGSAVRRRRRRPAPAAGRARPPDGRPRHHRRRRDGRGAAERRRRAGGRAR